MELLCKFFATDIHKCSLIFKNKSVASVQSVAEKIMKQAF